MFRTLTLSTTWLSIVAAFAILPLAGQTKSETHIVATFKGHTEPVYSVAFTPDGKYLVTGSFDNTIKLWDVGTGKEVKVYGGPNGHQKMVLCVAVSPDGQFLASGSIDNTLKLWDVPLVAPSRVVPAPDSVQAIALSPDGSKLAFGSKDGQVKLVNAADGKELFKLEGHTGPVTGVAFSPNGQNLATCGADKTLRFFNVANGQLLGTITAHGAAASAVQFSTNSAQAFSTGDDGYLRIWQLPLTPSKPIAVTQPTPFTTAVLTPDGTSLLAAGQDKIIRQTAIAGKETRTLTGATAELNALAISPNNAFLAAAGADRRVWLWNNANNQPLGSFLAHGGPVTAVQFHPSSTQIMTAGVDGQARFWIVPHVSTRTFTHPDSVALAVPAADGKKLYTGGDDKIVRIWNTSNSMIEKQFAGHTAPITALTASANGQIVISGSADATIRIWNQATGKESDILVGHAGPVTSLALNPAGTLLLSAGEDGAVKLWQLPLTGPKAMVHPDQVVCLAVSPDGSKILTGGQDKVVRLWNLANATNERNFVGPTLTITAVAHSSDGKYVVGASADKTLHLWASADAKVLQKLTYATVIHAATVTPDSQFVVAGLADGTIKMHKTIDGKEDKTFAGHKGAVTGLAVSPKGDLLISSGADKTIQVWTIADAKPKTVLTHVGPIAAFALSKDGMRVAAAADKIIKVWNLVDGKELATIVSPTEVKGLGLAPDGSRLVVGGADKFARVYELDGRLLELLAHDGPVLGVSLLDAKRVVTVSADKIARLWTSALIWSRHHGGPVRQALFSPKGEVVTCGDDKAVKWWNATDGKEIKSLAAHDGPVLGLSFSGDGGKLVTFGADKQIKLWGTAAANPIDAAKP
ncbi:MAG: WD40 repeat domain-containing protein, partial [Gemmataceae bacterium]|nr:WD40 repeat domain-containing protein [Gemmataceae bacterium]